MAPRFHFGSGMFWVTFDDVSLKKANSANLVVNSDFSASTDWTESPRAEFSATSYSLTAWLRGENDPESGDGAWEVRAAYYNSAGTFISEQAVVAEVLAPSSWTQKGGHFTTLNNAATVRIRLLYYFGSGWVAFDDISLLKNATSSNLVPNANFESSSSWSAIRQVDHPGTSFLHSNWGTAAGHNSVYAYVISNHHYGYLDSDPIAVTAGQRYMVQTFLRGELDPEQSGGCWSLRIQFYTNTVGIGNNGYQDAATRCNFDPKQDVQWRELSGIFTPPANTTAIKIRLFSYMNSGWVAFDDVRLRTAPVVLKYYYFNGQRIAMRKDGTLVYLHNDQLGSVVLSTDSNGDQSGSASYQAYGSRRGGDEVTEDYGFTGQREDSSLLVYMNARYYDPLLGTFVSPDTMVPDAGNVFDWNRYMYVRGRVLGMNDPNGHAGACAMTGVPYVDVPCQIGDAIYTYGPAAVDLVSQWADKTVAMWNWMFNNPNATNTANTVSQSGNSSTGDPWDPNKYQGAFKNAAERYQYQTSHTLLNQQTRLNITMNGKADTVDVDGIVNNFIHESKYLDPATDFYSKQIGKGGPSGLELHVKGWADLLQRESAAAQQFGYQGVKVFTNSAEAKAMAEKLFADKDWFKMIEVIYEATK